MTNRQGRVNRKYYFTPNIPKEPKQVVYCVCPHCGSPFEAEKMEGGYLRRTCPVCKETISGNDYDALAKKITSKHASQISEQKKLETQKRHADRLTDRTNHALLKPLNAYFNNKANHISQSLQKIDASNRLFKIQLDAIAHYHYYVSEWYQRTHFPLERKVVDPFRVTPSYLANGAWYMPLGDNKTIGTLSEIKVFDALIKAVQDPTSPLYRAQIVPNVYLPKPNEKIHGYGSFWSQIDCIVFTRKAAFVLEVKHRWKHVVAFNNDPAKIYSVACEDMPKDLEYPTTSSCPQRDSLKKMGFTNEDDFAIDQNETHTLAFTDTCKLYPYEKIYEQTIFVNPLSFRTDSKKFHNNINVSCVDNDEPDFLEPIYDVLNNLPDMQTQEEIEKYAEDFLQKYGDLNQERGFIHKQRLKNKRAS